MYPELPWLDEIVRAKTSERIPVVLTREEVQAVIGGLDGPIRLLALLLYGAGLRLLEALRLRVKDVDFKRNQITMRSGKGGKDRVTMLPAAVGRDLGKHLEAVRDQHAADVRAGAGWVDLPWALARKYPSAGREWIWQWVFPATGRRRRHPHGAGIAGPSRRRHHHDLHPRPQPRSRRRPEPRRPPPRPLTKVLADNSPNQKYPGPCKTGHAPRDHAQPRVPEGRSGHNPPTTPAGLSRPRLPRRRVVPQKRRLCGSRYF